MLRFYANFVISDNSQWNFCGIKKIVFAYRTVKKKEKKMKNEKREITEIYYMSFVFRRFEKKKHTDNIVHGIFREMILQAFMCTEILKFCKVLWTKSCLVRRNTVILYLYCCIVQWIVNKYMCQTHSCDYSSLRTLPIFIPFMQPQECFFFFWMITFA